MRLFLALLTFTVWNSAVLAQAAQIEMTATDLDMFCNSSDPTVEPACRFYILGVAQGISIGAGAANDKAHFCIPDDVPTTQLVAIFRRTAAALKSKFPADMKLPAASIVGAAFAREYPCK